eukprot:scaffold2678_cov22-Tisochrysis_lutea.AAC.1
MHEHAQELLSGAAADFPPEALVSVPGLVVSEGFQCTCLLSCNLLHASFSKDDITGQQGSSRSQAQQMLLAQ